MTATDIPTRGRLARRRPLSLTLRRRLFAAATISTGIVVIGLMLSVLMVNGPSGPGFSVADGIMLACFIGTLPWTIIGFWNAIIGFGLLVQRRDPVSLVTPLEELETDTPLTDRVAVVMPVFEENPERIFANLQAAARDVLHYSDGAQFDFFLLSDTQDPAIAAEEERRFAEWKETALHPDRLHYRRRADNTGKKTGNLWDFIDTHGDRYDHMVVFDADSVMSGSALVRIARHMQANPSLGILQTLAVGLPAASPFARLFQFGMRHGMRAYTTGSAWWQGDFGPYWGHNAIIRLSAFREHCKLPVLSGKPPFGGMILSHDQVEAVLMRRAGYEVRVLPVEDGSYEENPPTLTEFIRRELRWCQGNFQYFRLLGMPGVSPLGRLQLLLAILMYLSPIFWIGFMWTGFGQVIADTLTASTAVSDAAAAPVLPWGDLGNDAAIILLAVMIGMIFAPKLMGVSASLVRGPARLSYGGARRLLGGALTELILSMLTAPVVAVSISIFAVGLLFGKRITWGRQQRENGSVAFRDAMIALWPHMLLGAGTAVVLSVTAPSLLLWAAPVVTGLILAAPVAWLTSLPGLGRQLERWALCAIPEEFDRTRLAFAATG